MNPWHNHGSACVLKVGGVQRSSMVEIGVSVRAVLLLYCLSGRGACEEEGRREPWALLLLA